MQAGQDITMAGSTLAALGENGSMILSAGHNLTMGTDELTAKKDMTEDSDNYIRTYRKTETSNTLTAGKDITMTSGNDMKARNTTVASENGQISIKAANDITIENGYIESKDDYGLKYKESGFLSHKTTTIKSHDESKTATGSIISGDKVSIISGGNTTITASNVVGTDDVSITSGKDTAITSAEEVEQHDYEKRVKKSGLLGGGLGFTIGSEKRKDQYADADVTQKGSTVGSISGNVTIDANKDVHVDASDVISGKDISLTGENVDISSKDNVYHSEEKHEYKKSGLTVSVGGATIDAINSVVQPITRADEVKDKRLAGLYVVKAGQEANQISKAYKGQQDVIDSLYDKAGKESDLWAKGKDWKEADKVKDNQLGGKNTFTLNVDIGTSHSQAESHSETKEAAGSHVNATGDMIIKATKEDVHIKGSQVSGENVTLDAKKDIDISAAENSNTTKENTKSSGASLGASIGGGGLQGVSASYSKAKDHIKENETTYEKSQVTANKDMTFTSGKNTSIVGSEMTGNKVTGNVGGNLSIETKQDKKTYEEKNTSTGLSVNYGVKNGKTSASGGASKDTIHSNYESATDQAGIRAGDEGFDITVKENTNLKGSVIDSTATKDKNRLTTGTLTWEDTTNKADYKESGAGLTVNTDKDAKYNEKGITPAIPTGSRDKASSTTKSAIAERTIEITDKAHQKQDISELNRDTKHSLNQLGEIFDKTKVSERQELAGLFGEMAFNQLHNAKLTPNQRSAWHAFLGGIMGELSNKDFLGGATAAGINEMLIKQIEKASHGDPALMQWMSATVGGITGELVSKNPQLGAGTAASGTKHNDLDEELNARLMDENRYYEKYSYKDESGNIQVITLEDFEKHIPSDILEPTTEGAGSALINQELNFLEKMQKYTEKNYPALKAIAPGSFESITFLKKASSAYGKIGWIELYFEIALYNSQYQIDSIKDGEYYE